MKSRTKLFFILQKFFVEIRNQFHTSICILRSDNALEYLFAPFFAFLFSHGILYQSSCAYTQQQNGVVENRHLVETSRILLLQHTIPQRFLGDAILTACYLINRMPYSILFLILFSFLINLFFVYLRVFSGALVLSTYFHS